MSINSMLVPADAFAPGELLREELEARGWSQAEFAEIIGRPVRTINEVSAGKRGISPQTAKAFAAAFGTSPQFWMNLDAAYQLHKEAPAPDRIARKAKARDRFPVREMVKRGWVEPSEDQDVFEARLCRFFGISNIEDKLDLAFAAKRANPEESLSPLQRAWLFRVKQIATAMPLKVRYSPERLRDALPRLHALMSAAEETRHVPALLAECGVRFVVVEFLPSSKIDGVTCWLPGEEPVIGLSLRLDRIDNFWFVLRHEIEHVLRGDRHGIDEELDAGATDLPPEEIAANNASLDFAVPAAEWEDWVDRVDPMFTDDVIVGFAARLGIASGIVAGRVQRHTQQYNRFRGHLDRIRQIVSSSAMADGYGHLCQI
jgi:HTH-type transcriptional regulator/antitoxin HigA